MEPCHQHTAINLVKSLNGLGSSGNHRSHMGNAGAKDAEAKLHTKAYNDTVAKQANFLHGAQFNGSAGSDVGSGNLTTRSTYLPFCCAVVCSDCWWCVSTCIKTKVRSNIQHTYQTNRPRWRSCLDGLTREGKCIFPPRHIPRMCKGVDIRKRKEISEHKR